MTKHPCFICEDVGSFEYAGRTHACDCDAAHSIAARATHQEPAATQLAMTDRTRLNESNPNTAVAALPSASGPKNTTSNHFIGAPSEEVDRG